MRRERDGERELLGKQLCWSAPFFPIPTTLWQREGQAQIMVYSYCGWHSNRSAHLGLSAFKAATDIDWSLPIICIQSRGDQPIKALSPYLPSFPSPIDNARFSMQHHSHCHSSSFFVVLMHLSWSAVVLLYNLLLPFLWRSLSLWIAPHATDVPAKHSDHDLCSDKKLSIFEGTGELIKAQFIDLIKKIVWNQFCQV